MNGYDELLRLKGTTIGDKLLIIPYYWNPNTLAYEVAVQAGGGSGGGPATIADGADVTQGAKADATWDGSAAASIVSILRWCGTKLEAVRALLAGTVTVSTGLTQPLTDTQLRASAVPVSGTVTATGTFWQATQPVSGTFWQGTQPVSGAFFQATQPISAVALPLPANAAIETGGHLAALDTKTPALGSALSAASTPVVLASDQLALPLPTNAAQETSGNLDKIVAAQNIVGAAMRLRNRIAMLALMQTPIGAGFVPLEIPEFLGGI